MAVDIKRIDENTWSFEEPGVRFFLLTGTEKALLIDSGMQTNNAKELAGELTTLPLSLLNTHADPDHIGSNDEFDSFYIHPAEASNYYNSQKRKGKMLPVWDGDIIDLGGRPLRIIEIPGHTPGSIAILDEKNRRLFSGDPVQDGRIFMFGVQRELHAYRHSLLKLQNHAGAFDEIYPSHGTCPVKPPIIMELYEAAGKILDGQLTGHQEEMFGNPITAYDAGPAVFLCNPEEKGYRIGK